MDKQQILDLLRDYAQHQQPWPEQEEEAKRLLALLQERPPTDTLLQSAWRGRVLAALSAGVAAWIAGTELIDHLMAEGVQGDFIVHAAAALERVDLLIITGTSLVAMAVSAWSKWREWVRRGDAA